MAPPLERTASEVEQLNERLRALERRVAALEGQSHQTSGAAPESVSALPLTAPLPAHQPASLPGFAGRTVPILGKAVLGFAGAYLLRAVAEAGIVPKQPVLAVAVIYAGLWLVWAARRNAISRFASATYAVTSALILSPLLWESTTRLQLLSPTFSGIVLVAFMLLAFVLARHANLQVVPWVATLTAAITAVALIISTQALVPLATTVLTAAIIAESWGHWSSLRMVPAAAADFVLWLLIDVMTAPNVPSGYRPASPVTVIALCLGLLVIYGGSIGIRTLALRQRITIFEIIQAPIAVVVAIFGITRASRGSAVLWLGALLFLLAMFCYWGTLFRFDDAAHARNRRVYAAWAAALIITLASLFLSARIGVLCLCLAALLAVIAFRLTGRLSLGMHASFYLAAAAVVSPLLVYAKNTLAGTLQIRGGPSVWGVALSALLAYIIGSRGGSTRGKQRLLWVVPLAVVGLAGAAAAVVAIVQIADRSQLNAARLSVIRTLVICSLAWIFAFVGSHTKRAELGWVAYAAVGFGTLKLLFEDLRFGNPTSLVASLLFYGLILILLPRLMRRNSVQREL